MKLVDEWKFEGCRDALQHILGGDFRTTDQTCPQQPLGEHKLELVKPLVPDAAMCHVKEHKIRA